MKSAWQSWASPHGQLGRPAKAARFFECARALKLAKLPGPASTQDATSGSTCTLKPCSQTPMGMGCRGACYAGVTWTGRVLIPGSSCSARRREAGEMGMTCSPATPGVTVRDASSSSLYCLQ